MQSERYARQMVLPEIGEAGQLALQRTKVLVVGAGGLGCPVLSYLAAAGVGTLAVIDDDLVDISNLQRQVLFQTADQGRPKVEVAKERLQELNPDIDVVIYNERLTTENAERLFGEYEIIIDGSDNFTTKFLINDTAVKLSLPVVYGSVSGYDAQLAVFWATKGACYRCLYPAPPESYVPNCAEAGVLGAFTGMVGSMQALEAIKLILNNPELPALVSKIAVFNVASMHFSDLAISNNPECPICSLPTQEIDLASNLEKEIPLCSAETSEISLEEALKLPASQFIDVREKNEWVKKRISGARNLPLSEIESMDGIDLQLNGTTVLYCVSGVRSARALELLQQKGFSGLKNLRCGIVGWTGTFAGDDC